MLHRIHIFGASGSGTTTLGQALGQRLQILHLEADDFYWKPTDPPYREKRPPSERVASLQAHLQGHQEWVLSGGSMHTWGASLVPQFTLAILLTLDPKIRMARVHAREQARYGTRIAPGGDMYVKSTEYLEWAASYDIETDRTRCLRRHLDWLNELKCATLRLDSSASVAELVDHVLQKIEPERWLRIQRQIRR